jgi:branched-chain amino acid transport system permease protein
VAGEFAAMTYLLQALVNGLLGGGLLALIAVGFTLVWGVLNVVNLAHGALVVLGAYVTWELATTVGVNPILAAAAASAVLFGFGYALQRGLLNLVARAPVLLPLLVTFGIGLLLKNAMAAVFTRNDRALLTAYSLSALRLGGVYVPVLGLVSLVLAVAVTLGVTLALGRTGYGMAIRAVGMDRDAARLMGIRVRHVYALTFGIGAALAGLAGSMVATTGTFSPLSAEMYTLESFVIAVVGGVGNTSRALVGGLSLGMLEALVGQYLSGTLESATVFAVLLLALVFRPHGLVGPARFASRVDM